MIGNEWNIILGSGSPRRSQLLKEMGLSFDVRVSDADESAPPELNPVETVEWVAKEKALALRHSLNANDLLITADTEVWQDGHRFGKPSNRQDAILMLGKLSGTSHQVISGFCLCDTRRIQTYHTSTKVYFKSLDSSTIEHYVDHHKPFDKAGAYGIQEWIGMVGIERIEGSYFNVVGLPTSDLWTALKNW